MFLRECFIRKLPIKSVSLRIFSIVFNIKFIEQQMFINPKTLIVKLDIGSLNPLFLFLHTVSRNMNLMIAKLDIGSIKKWTESYSMYINSNKSISTYIGVKSKKIFIKTKKIQKKLFIVTFVMHCVISNVYIYMNNS